MSEEVGSAATRVALHAKTLIDGAAPHQQELAHDLATVAEAATAGTAEHDVKIKNLTSHVDKALDDRDAARKELEAHKAGTKTTIDEAIKDRDAAMKALAEANKQIDAHEKTIAEMEIEKSKLGVASTKGPSHADLKHESKASHSHKK